MLQVIEEMELNISDVRERVLNNNEIYTISQGKQVSIIIEDGTAHEESILKIDMHSACTGIRNSPIMILLLKKRRHTIE